jgi:protein-tyrosine-phosphatase
MAEGLFRKLAADKKGSYSASSAGVFATDGYGAMAETIRAMQTEGVDMSSHKSRRLTPDMIRGAYRIYAMEEGHRDAILGMAPEAEGKVFLLSEFSSDVKKREGGINIPDPIRMSDAFYKQVLGEIRDCVQNVLKTLEGMA